MIGRCFVLSQDLAARDELDGGEWKFCEGRPQGHEQFGFCQQGTAAAFSPDSHYLLFGAPGTYNWKGESLLGEGRRDPKCPLTSELGLGAARGQARPHVPPAAPGTASCPRPAEPAHTQMGCLLSFEWPSAPHPAGMIPHARLGPLRHPSPHLITPIPVSAHPG